MAAAAVFSTDDSHHEFGSDVDFRDWIFPGDAQFTRATFSGEARFHKAFFASDARFEYCRFLGDARFHRTTFAANARFESATFSSNTGFERAAISGDSEFERSSFLRNAGFREMTFSGGAWFVQVTFEGFVTFANATFRRAASFHAIRSNRAFSMERASFLRVPDFIQAHFEEAPRLDNLQIHRSAADRSKERTKSRSSAYRSREDIPARYRALKRLAIHGHDHESEMKFFASEIMGARGITDFPLPWQFWRGAAWSGTVRWWVSWIYQIISNFGRSLVRPALLWLGTIAVSTAYFIGQSPDVVHQREAFIDAGAVPGLITYATVSARAWAQDQPCFVGVAGNNGERHPLVAGLVEPLRSMTNVTNEALHLAFRNAFILDAGSETAHRTYGCLYGIEIYGDRPVAVVPSDVAFASMLQKTISAVLIFLFGLGIRKMLRMK